MIRWGILGVGIAGRARARAMAADPRAEPVLGYRGDPAAVGLPAAPSAEVLLSSVDAVAVCSPNDTHPALVEAALSAGCHVICEYPLAGSAAEAARLLSLAKSVDRVLHVEHIELLGGAARWLRQRHLRPSRGAISFTGRRVAPLALANLARLHRLIDALGLPTAVRVTRRDRHHLQGTATVAGAPIALDFRCGPGLPRETRLSIHTEEHRITQHNRTITMDGEPVTLPEVGGLFLADQLAATARVLDGAESYVSEERILNGLRLADALAGAPLGQEVPLG